MKSIENLTKQIITDSNKLKTINNLNFIYSCIDLTNLNSYAKNSDIEELCKNASKQKYKDIEIPEMAAVCTYSTYMPLCKELLEDSKVKVATVSAAFPSGQSYSDVKYLETELAVEHGAEEIDIVMNGSSFLNGDESLVFDEIKTIKQICKNICFKVILETGLLKTESLIKEASLMALEAGADFIKTSTGKDGSYASYEAALIMCQAIKEFENKTRAKRGFKAAGGIATSDEAIGYFAIAKELLGDDYLIPSRFRIGASKLAGNLLEDMIIYESK